MWTSFWECKQKLYKLLMSGTFPISSGLSKKCQAHCLFFYNFNHISYHNSITAYATLNISPCDAKDSFVVSYYITL